MAKKDSYWFRHDSTAGRGLKMRKMAFKFGHWGKGIYWDVIEILRDQTNYQYESNPESLLLLADLIGCKEPEKFQEWFQECLDVELLKQKGGFFYSEILIKNMGKWEVKKKNGSSKKKRNGSEMEAKEVAKVEHKITVDKKTEENKTSNNKIEQFFLDLPNSTLLENIERDIKVDKLILIDFIPKFRKKVKFEYKDFYAFVEHFRNSFLIEEKNKQNGKSTKPSSATIIAPGKKWDD